MLSDEKVETCIELSGMVMQWYIYVDISVLLKTYFHAFLGYVY